MALKCFEHQVATAESQYMSSYVGICLDPSALVSAPVACLMALQPLAEAVGAANPVVPNERAVPDSWRSIRTMAVDGDDEGEVRM